MESEEHLSIDPAFVRGMTQSRYSRRDLLRLAGAGAGAAGLGALLSAPGAGAAAESMARAAHDSTSSYWKHQKRTGQLNFANWPLYIDVGNKKNDHPSIDLFEKKTGIKVNYFEVIQDDGPFFAKVRPSLAANQYSGYDLAVITNGIYLTDFMLLNYLVPLDHAKLPNFFKYASSKYKNPSYDPHNKYSVPWQSGMTGIAYNPKLTKRKITSFWDLWDPKFKGKVGMFADNEDLPNAVLVAMGKDPAKTNQSDWQKAAAKLQQQKSAGIVRQYYTQDYITALSNGDIWITQAWSGDVFQANASGAKDLEFVIPKQGGLLWTDNMVILKNAKNPLSAIEWMNFVYDPKIAAMLAEGINYVTPVPGARKYILADAAKAKGSNKASLEQLADSPLIFPSPQTYSKLYRYRVLNQTEVNTWNNIFQPIYQS